MAVNTFALPGKNVYARYRTRQGNRISGRIHLIEQPNRGFLYKDALINRYTINHCRGCQQSKDWLYYRHIFNLPGGLRAFGKVGKESDDANLSIIHRPQTVPIIMINPLTLTSKD